MCVYIYACELVNKEFINDIVQKKNDLWVSFFFFFACHVFESFLNKNSSKLGFLVSIVTSYCFYLKFSI